MSRTAKQTIAVATAIIIAGIAVYGSYLPMRKAEMFISTLQSLQTSPVNSLDELTSRLAVPLDYPSPIGQEELVRNTANNILSFLSQGADATSTAVLMSFVNSYYAPIIAQGKGMSFGQDLYLMGALNEVAYMRTGNPAYIADSRKYFEKAVALGPNRPQSLYGLFEVYRIGGDIAGMEKIGEKILSNWPSDAIIAASLRSLLNTASSTPVVAPKY